jgi:hypothetical protein
MRTFVVTAGLYSPGDLVGGTGGRPVDQLEMLLQSQGPMRTIVTAGLYSPGDLVGGLEAGRDELKTQFMTRQVIKFNACLRNCAIPYRY